SGDAYKFAARGKSNQPVVILDSTGRTYTVPAHTLPSARGQGEPLTGRISPPSGATFEGLLMGSDQQQVLRASDAGYGFVTTLASARGQGEPLTGRISPPSGATVEGLLRGSDKQQVLLASDAGYGFVTTLGDLEAKNKNGKAVLNLPDGSRVCAPALISEGDA